MRTLCTTALCATLIITGGVAQPQTPKHRSPTADAIPPAQADARKALPIAAEGEYRWGEPGEVIELYVEDGALRGYMTRRSERRDAGSSPMTFAFTKAGTSGATLSFTTRQIHGDWYSFEGHAVRGPAASPSRDGYYLLEGTLRLHLGPAHPSDESASYEPVSRQVSLKLAASGHHPE
jgi:hypothetical protein